MTTAATSVRRNLTIIVLCSFLIILSPLSVTAQKEADPPANVEAVVFLNPETNDSLFIGFESWESQDEVDFVMRVYENDNMVEGYLGEGFEVLSSTPLPEDALTAWGIDGGMEFEIEFEDDPGTVFVMPVELDVMFVMYLGEHLSERRLNRFVGDVI